MKTFSIGNITLDNALVLAPMAGVTDRAFRILCKEQGAGLVVGEMVSAKALHYHNEHTLAMLDVDPAEHPCSIQLFGHEPEILAEAAHMLNDYPIDIIDFNMGCPVPKVVKNGEGSALMLDEKIAGACMGAIVNATDKPVTVKMRAGFDTDHINAPKLAHIAEACGVKAVTIHGRTRGQYYTGHANWNIIREVKETVSIPVIGNGDINSAKDVLQMKAETGCDGFMIGRSALGNPWIFSQILHELETGMQQDKPNEKEVAAMVLRHAKLRCDFQNNTDVKRMRSHAAWYTSGYPFSSSVRREIMKVSSLDELETVMHHFTVRDFPNSNINNDVSK